MGNFTVLIEPERKILRSIIANGLPSVLNMQIYSIDDIRTVCAKIGALEDLEMFMANSTSA